MESAAGATRPATAMFLMLHEPRSSGGGSDKSTASSNIVPGPQGSEWRLRLEVSSCAFAHATVEVRWPMAAASRGRAVTVDWSGTIVVATPETSAALAPALMAVTNNTVPSAAGDGAARAAGGRRAGPRARGALTPATRGTGRAGDEVDDVVVLDGDGSGVGDSDGESTESEHLGVGSADGSDSSDSDPRRGQRGRSRGRRQGRRKLKRYTEPAEGTSHSDSGGGRGGSRGRRRDRGRSGRRGGAAATSEASDSDAGAAAVDVAQSGDAVDVATLSAQLLAMLPEDAVPAAEHVWTATDRARSPFFDAKRGEWANAGHAFNTIRSWGQVGEGSGGSVGRGSAHRRRVVVCYISFTSCTVRRDEWDVPRSRRGGLAGIDALALPRSETAKAELGLAGLQNQANTCYLNSVLQTLFHTRAVRGVVYAAPVEWVRAAAARPADDALTVDLTDASSSAAAAAAAAGSGVRAAVVGAGAAGAGAGSGGATAAGDGKPVGGPRWSTIADPKDVGEGDFSKRTRVMAALQSTFYEMDCGMGQGRRTVTRTTHLTSSFGWTRDDAFVQHDAQEFLRVLVGHLEETMAGTAMAHCMRHLMEGELVSRIRVPSTNYTSHPKVESFYDVQLPVSGVSGVIDSFQSYVAPETMDGANQVQLPDGSKADGVREMRFLRFPPVLHLQLQRFTLDPHTLTRRKINTPFAFPDTLDLTPYQADEELREAVRARREGAAAASAAAAADDEPPPVAADMIAACAAAAAHTASPASRPIYRLHSVLVHSGGAGGGHYYAFARPRLGLDSWTNAAAPSAASPSPALAPTPSAASASTAAGRRRKRPLTMRAASFLAASTLLRGLEWVAPGGASQAGQQAAAASAHASTSLHAARSNLSSTIGSATRAAAEWSAVAHDYDMGGGEALPECEPFVDAGTAAAPPAAPTTYGVSSLHQLGRHGRESAPSSMLRFDSTSDTWLTEPLLGDALVDLDASPPVMPVAAEETSDMTAGGAGGSFRGWYKFNDDRVSPATIREAVTDNYGSGSSYESTGTSAYYLVYLREDTLRYTQLPLAVRPMPTDEPADKLVAGAAFMAVPLWRYEGGDARAARPPTMWTAKRVARAVALWRELMPHSMVADTQLVRLGVAPPALPLPPASAARGGAPPAGPAAAAVLIDDDDVVADDGSDLLVVDGRPSDDDEVMVQEVHAGDGAAPRGGRGGKAGLGKLHTSGGSASSGGGRAGGKRGSVASSAAGAARQTQLSFAASGGGTGKRDRGGGAAVSPSRSRRNSDAVPSPSSLADIAVQEPDWDGDESIVVPVPPSCVEVAPAAGGARAGDGPHLQWRRSVFYCATPVPMARSLVAIANARHEQQLHRDKAERARVEAQRAGGHAALHIVLEAQLAHSGLTAVQRDLSRHVVDASPSAPRMITLDALAAALPQAFHMRVAVGTEVANISSLVASHLGLPSHAIRVRLVTLPDKDDTAVRFGAVVPDRALYETRLSEAPAHAVNVEEVAQGGLTVAALSRATCDLHQLLDPRRKDSLDAALETVAAPPAVLWRRIAARSRAGGELGDYIAAPYKPHAVVQAHRDSILQPADASAPWPDSIRLARAALSLAECDPWAAALAQLAEAAAPRPAAPLPSWLATALASLPTPDHVAHAAVAAAAAAAGAPPPAHTGSPGRVSRLRSMLSASDGSHDAAGSPAGDVSSLVPYLSRWCMGPLTGEPAAPTSSMRDTELDVTSCIYHVILLVELLPTARGDVGAAGGDGDVVMEASAASSPHRSAWTMPPRLHPALRPLASSLQVQLHNSRAWLHVLLAHLARNQPYMRTQRIVRNVLVAAACEARAGGAMNVSEADLVGTAAVRAYIHRMASLDPVLFIDERMEKDVVAALTANSSLAPLVAVAVYRHRTAGGAPAEAASRTRTSPSASAAAAGAAATSLLGPFAPAQPHPTAAATQFIGIAYVPAKATVQALPMLLAQWLGLLPLDDIPTTTSQRVADALRARATAHKMDDDDDDSSTDSEDGEGGGGTVASGAGRRASARAATRAQAEAAGVNPGLMRALDAHVKVLQWPNAPDGKVVPLTAALGLQPLVPAAVPRDQVRRLASTSSGGAAKSVHLADGDCLVVEYADGVDLVAAAAATATAAKSKPPRLPDIRDALSGQPPRAGDGRRQQARDINGSLSTDKALAEAMRASMQAHAAGGARATAESDAFEFPPEGAGASSLLMVDDEGAAAGGEAMDDDEELQAAIRASLAEAGSAAPVEPAPAPAPSIVGAKRPRGDGGGNGDDSGGTSNEPAPQTLLTTMRHLLFPWTDHGEPSLDRAGSVLRGMSRATAVIVDACFHVDMATLLSGRSSAPVSVGDALTLMSTPQALGSLRASLFRPDATGVATPGLAARYTDVAVVDAVGRTTLSSASFEWVAVAVALRGCVGRLLASAAAAGDEAAAAAVVPSLAQTLAVLLGGVDWAWAGESGDGVRLPPLPLPLPLEVKAKWTYSWLQGSGVRPQLKRRFTALATALARRALLAERARAAAPDSAVSRAGAAAKRRRMEAAAAAAASSAAASPEAGSDALPLLLPPPRVRPLTDKVCARIMEDAAAAAFSSNRIVMFGDSDQSLLTLASTATSTVAPTPRDVSFRALRYDEYAGDSESQEVLDGDALYRTPLLDHCGPAEEIYAAHQRCGGRAWAWTPPALAFTLSPVAAASYHQARGMEVAYAGTTSDNAAALVATWPALPPAVQRLLLLPSTHILYVAEPAVATVATVVHELRERLALLAAIAAGGATATPLAAVAMQEAAVAAAKALLAAPPPPAQPQVQLHAIVAQVTPGQSAEAETAAGAEVPAPSVTWHTSRLVAALPTSMPLRQVGDLVRAVESGAGAASTIAGAVSSAGGAHPGATAAAAWFGVAGADALAPCVVATKLVVEALRPAAPPAAVPRAPAPAQSGGGGGGGDDDVIMVGSSDGGDATAGGGSLRWLAIVPIAASASPSTRAAAGPAPASSQQSIASFFSAASGKPRARDSAAPRPTGGAAAEAPLWRAVGRTRLVPVTAASSVRAAAFAAGIIPAADADAPLHCVSDPSAPQSTHVPLPPDATCGSIFPPAIFADYHAAPSSLPSGASSPIVTVAAAAEAGDAGEGERQLGLSHRASDGALVLESSDDEAPSAAAQRGRGGARGRRGEDAAASAPPPPRSHATSSTLRRRENVTRTPPTAPPDSDAESDAASVAGGGAASTNSTLPMSLSDEPLLRPAISSLRQLHAPAPAPSARSFSASPPSSALTLPLPALAELGSPAADGIAPGTIMRVGGEAAPRICLLRLDVHGAGPCFVPCIFVVVPAPDAATEATWLSAAFGGGACSNVMGGPALPWDAAIVPVAQALAARLPAPNPPEPEPLECDDDDSGAVIIGSSSKPAGAARASAAARTRPKEMALSFR